ncbi:uncharacterized protein G2W53_015337 [Senna tora]|uniref:Uncharacterized protein n=1 Tax=Senna tora TaxID=362788 RepID=A0A834WV73_9FABA|nr:uncharacterized protein G2W53_015337 [Senna tora]
MAFEDHKAQKNKRYEYKSKPTWLLSYYR